MDMTRYGSKFDGLGDIDLTSADLSTISDAITKGMVAINSQRVFDINLQRIQNGLPPIPAQYASPTVNFGIAGVDSSMLLIGGAVLLFLLLRR